jgi:hypothetical protein
MLARHRGGNRLCCDFEGFLDYLLRFNDGCGTGSHTLKHCTEDLELLLFIKFHA